MRVHVFPDDALSMAVPCFMCHLEHKDCTNDECKRPHMNILTDEDLEAMRRIGRRK